MIYYKVGKISIFTNRFKNEEKYMLLYIVIIITVLGLILCIMKDRDGAKAKQIHDEVVFRRNLERKSD